MTEGYIYSRPLVMHGPSCPHATFAGRSPHFLLPYHYQRGRHPWECAALMARQREKCLEEQAEESPWKRLGEHS